MEGIVVKKENTSLHHFHLIVHNSSSAKFSNRKLTRGSTIKQVKYFVFTQSMPFYNNNASQKVIFQRLNIQSLEKYLRNSMAMNSRQYSEEGPRHIHPHEMTRIYLYR